MIGLAYFIGLLFVVLSDPSTEPIAFIGGAGLVAAAVLATGIDNQWPA